MALDDETRKVITPWSASCPLNWCRGLIPWQRCCFLSGRLLICLVDIASQTLTKWDSSPPQTLEGFENLSFCGCALTRLASTSTHSCSDGDWVLIYCLLCGQTHFASGQMCSCFSLDLSIFRKLTGDCLVWVGAGRWKMRWKHSSYFRTCPCSRYFPGISTA